MLIYQLEVVGDEFLTSIDHNGEFYVTLLFDRSFYRPMCIHMGNTLSLNSTALDLSLGND